MSLDTFERYKNNLFLSPITSDTLQNLGERCGLSPGANVLDVNCGTGGAAMMLAAGLNGKTEGFAVDPSFNRSSIRS